jgi:hypothetical protein
MEKSNSPWLDYQEYMFQKIWFEQMEILFFKYGGKVPEQEINNLVNKMNHNDEMQC